MNDKIIFMTGATTGFGKIVAKHEANKGAKVVILARSAQKAEALIKEHKSEHSDSGGSIEYIEGNLSSFQSVREACETFKKRYNKLNVLILNAGIMNFKFRESDDGIEETLQVNLLSSMLIAHLLFDLIVKDSNAKIIFTSSALHQGTINFNNIEFRENFTGLKAYRQSKLGVILMCRLLSKSLSKDEISIFNIHPGVVRTQLGRSAGVFSKIIFWLMGKSLVKGAQTHLFMLNQNNSEIVSGEYYANSKVTKITSESYDMELAEKLKLKIQNYLAPFTEFDSPFLNKK